MNDDGEGKQRAVAARGESSARPASHRARHPLSADSHEPWEPPQPRHAIASLVLGGAAATGCAPHLYHDVVCATAVLLLPLFLRPWLGPAWLHWLPLAAGAAAGLLAALRWLEPVSYDKMLEAEAAFLDTVHARVEHHWTAFSTAGAAWRIHSL